MTQTFAEQSTPFAEIITSSLDSFTAHCWQWNVIPPFGSIVTAKTAEYVLYGVVYNSKTESLDPMHMLHVYKKTEDEMKKEYPHLFDALKTTIDVFILGHESDKVGGISYARTPFPARLYSFVCILEKEDLKKFLSDQNCLSRLIQNQNTVPFYEDLLLTVLLQQKKLGILSEERIARFVGDYSNVVQARYSDLQHFIKKIESF